ncbi:MAG: UvrD-helicase domain-containing protein [Actinomycetales bacterium]|nr:UvrD-helicase domain-containing protein [Actinomycetales bacterium]
MTLDHPPSAAATGTEAVSSGSPFDGLTTEQLRAAGSPTRGVYIEAAPGSGKTTVSAHRFGTLRFSPSTPPLNTGRAVVATSFTRAATTELRQRVARLWGPEALSWPHRVVTIDTIIADLLTHLLIEGVVTWPGGHTRLNVLDTWKVVTPCRHTTAQPHLAIDGANRIYTTQTITRRSLCPGQQAYAHHIGRGACTHDDVRQAMNLLLQQNAVQEAVSDRLERTIRALIVDEVFDANELDLAIVRAAARADVDITLVGDPWQAIYEFRGARSALIEPFVQELRLKTYPLTESFRWESTEQQALADTLRAGRPVLLTPLPDTIEEPADVILGARWDTLWTLGDHVLPLAFLSSTTTPEEAAVTLLLNRMTRRAFTRQATFVGDALVTLATADTFRVEDLDDPLAQILEQLASATDTQTTESVWPALTEIVAAVSHRRPRVENLSCVRYLRLLHDRLGKPSSALIPALTVHQAKGGEWPVVAVHLAVTERRQLAAGLSVNTADDRLIYVACTRARRRTYQA